MISPKHVREYVIDTALKDVGLYSKAASNLLMGTAAQESEMGHFLRQRRDGPALGIFQMEPDTHNDIWYHYLTFKHGLALKIKEVSGRPYPLAEDMIWDLRYAALMARVHYLRKKQPLPAHDDVLGLAYYWKAHYNTWKGKGTAEEFVRNYERYGDTR